MVIEHVPVEKENTVLNISIFFELKDNTPQGKAVFQFEYKDGAYNKPENLTPKLNFIINKVNELCQSNDLGMVQLSVEHIPIKRINSKIAWDYLYENLKLIENPSLIFIQAQGENPPAGHPVIQCVQDLFHETTVISNAYVSKSPDFSIAFPNSCSITIGETNGLSSDDSGADCSSIISDIQVLSSQIEAFGATLDFQEESNDSQRLKTSYEFVGIVLSLLLKANHFGKLFSVMSN